MSSRAQSFLFGGKAFPIKSANRHLLYLGATGSGKTVSLRLLMQSMIPEIGLHHHEGGYRALILDVKQELLVQLWELGAACPVILSNPFDARSYVWDMAADVTSPAAAYEVANILLPVSENAVQPFWENAAVNLFCGVLKALHGRAPHAWSLRHVCLIMRSAHHLRELLSQSSLTRYLIQRYLQEPKLMNSVLATVDSKMEAYNIIAALWHRAKDKFSIRDFVNSETILILGNHEEAREAVDAINRVLFARITEALLGQQDSNTRRTFVFLDEVQAAGRIGDKLLSLALRGRSRGVCLAAGAQGHDGLQQVYGEDAANELLGQFAYKAILKLESPTTAAWAASQFGTMEVRERNAQSSRSFGGEETHISQGISETIRVRDVVLANQLMNMPPTSGAEGLHGFYKTPYGSFSSHIDFVPLLSRRSEAERRNLPANYNFMLRDESDQYLEDWTAEELERFGLTPIPPEEETGSPRQRERNRPPRDRENRGRNRNSGRNRNVDPDQEEEADEDED